MAKTGLIRCINVTVVKDSKGNVVPMKSRSPHVGSTELEVGSKNYGVWGIIPPKGEVYRVFNTTYPLPQATMSWSEACTQALNWDGWTAEERAWIEGTISRVRKVEQAETIRENIPQSKKDDGVDWSKMASPRGIPDFTNHEVE